MSLKAQSILQLTSYKHEDGSLTFEVERVNLDYKEDVAEDGDGVEICIRHVYRLGTWSYLDGAIEALRKEANR